MNESNRELFQRVRRTRREAEAALEHARAESAALRAHLAMLPVEQQAQASVLEMLARLDVLDAARENAVAAIARQGRPFEA